jgi:Tol biopolymer transport system component
MRKARYGWPAASSIAALCLATTLHGQTVTDSVVAVTGVEDAYGHWSPDGTRIVLQSDRAGQWDIYVINADGSGLRRLTDHPAHDRTPVWSPDGTSIAFQSERDGNREIYRMDPDGSNPRNITNHPAEDSHPKWSADGRRIVFDSDRDGADNYEVYEMSADGSGVVRLTDYSDWDTYSSVSPDGGSVLWRRVTTEDGKRNSELFIMNRDGSEPANLTNHAAFDGWPAWSPDGSRILFASDRARSRVWHLYTMGPDGSEIVRLTVDLPGDGHYTQPMWSPDGSRIVATRYLGEGAELVVLHLGPGGRASEVTRTGKTARSAEAALTGEWFVPVEEGELVTDGNLSRGVAWGDFDGDGYPDLAVANTISQPQFIYRNDGDGTFTQLVENSITLAAGWTESVGWIDFDNDGDLDLFTANNNRQPNGLFRNDGAGNFEALDAGALTGDTTSSTMSCWADYDGDGDLDAFVVNRDGEDDALYRSDGGGTFERVEGGPPVSNGGQGRACGAADADGDGNVDLYVGNGRRQRNYFYRNEGDWRFTEITEGAFVRDTAYSYGVSWVDYDYDDDLDLYVTNISESNALYVNDGAGNFTPLQDSPLVTDGGVSKGQTWGDLDNDGDLDLFIANGTEAPDMRNFLYRNDGPAGFTRVMEGAVAAHADTSAGAAAADYDRDGDLDLFVANWGGGDEDNRLYRNETSDRSWIVIRLEGQRSNRFGIGARLRLKATIGGRSTWQTRWLLPATGYASGNEPTVHFGVGDAVAIEALEVHWPSGVVDRHNDVQPDAFYIVVEGEGIRLQD